MQMTATSSLVETFRFVRVGDSVETLTETYPEAVQWEEGSYIYNDEQADDPSSTTGVSWRAAPITASRSLLSPVEYNKQKTQSED
jgi:hypothetical protein